MSNRSAGRLDADNVTWPQVRRRVGLLRVRSAAQNAFFWKLIAIWCYLKIKAYSWSYAVFSKSDKNG